MRAKRRVVEAFEIAKRWEEEVILVKREMRNFIKFYAEVNLPRIESQINKLEEMLQSEFKNLKITYKCNLNTLSD